MVRLSSRFYLQIVFLAFALMTGVPVYSWGLTGHRTIAEIAQQHLTNKSRKELKKLIGRETLAWWANWPDFIKSDSTWNQASPWHYVDLPGNMEKQKFIEDLKKLPGKNLYTQIQTMLADLGNQTLPADQRRSALYFLIHLVGDLHQPLHVGRDEDAGGNKIVVYWFDRKTNLHSLWDNMLIEYQQYSYTEYANLLNTREPDQVKTWQASPLEDWFYESHVISDSIYAASPNEAKLGYKYNFQFQKILDEQLLKGGVRLAALLNQVLSK